MLTDARPLFEGIPASFADPLAIAAQQAPGTSSLVVAAFLSPPAADFPPPAYNLQPPASPTYDLYACHGGEVVAVAHMTAEFRFPVMPARALRRFVEARDGGGRVRLSLYELSPALLTMLLETIHYAPCLKLHVRGIEDAPLVAAQLQAAACRSGVLEFNSFDDPLRPSIRLLPVQEVPEAGLLARALAHGGGRVLLYDRHRNAHVARDRGLEPEGVGAALEQAHRLAQTRTTLAARTVGRLHAFHEERREVTAAAADETHLVEYFSTVDASPRRVARSHPAAQALGDLLAEEHAAAAGAAREPAPDDPALDALSALLGGLLADDDVGDADDTPAHEAEESNAEDEAPAENATTPPPLDTRHAPLDTPNSPPPPQPPISTLQPPLDASLRSLVERIVALVAHAAGAERADEHAAHVAATLECSLPPDAAHVVPFLQALLTDDPPRRWYGFKMQRRRAYAEAAEAVRAVFDAHRHDGHPAVNALPALWARLQR